ncbi:MAG: G8 domain-containing protein, partial [Kiritimatiellae bacterium]|nr:G8 domain-containing protein [Kiritimatiellia bacterium]
MSIDKVKCSLSKTFIAALAIAPISMFAEQRTWTGAVDTLWSNAGNWSPEGVPQAGDDVTIPGSTSVIIVEDMPNLNSLDLTGTLMTSNWFTAVRADTITINKNGTLTCGDPFTSSESSNRIWVVCRDLTVASGGKINAND